MLNEIGHSKFQEELTKAIVEIKQNLKNPNLCMDNMCIVF